LYLETSSLTFLSDASSNGASGRLVVPASMPFSLRIAFKVG